MSHHYFWADKHRVCRCDSDTKQVIETIAFCDNSTTALKVAIALNVMLRREALVPDRGGDKQ